MINPAGLRGRGRGLPAPSNNKEIRLGIRFFRMKNPGKTLFSTLFNNKTTLAAENYSLKPTLLSYYIPLIYRYLFLNLMTLASTSN